jgi:E3 ubiquitin-protein ligase HUWE1
MTESIKPQIDSFAMGFHSVIPKSYIRFFKGDELELLLCGLPDIDIPDLKSNTEYPVCETTQWFWKVARSLRWERKQKLLLFWTAYPRVPYGGFKSVEKPLKIEVGEQGDEYLPQAHTCFKILKLSNYSSKAMLKKNLITSIEYGYVGHGMP